MHFCATIPPNSSTLSDSVIGNVMQRSTWNTHANSRASSTFPQSHHHHQHPFRQASNSIANETERTSLIHTKVPIPDALEGSAPAMSRHTGISSNRRSVTCLLSDLEAVNNMFIGIQGTKHRVTPALQQTIVADALRKKKRHRERCRINQARYRERQLKAQTEIEVAIVKLKFEIGQLEVKCNMAAPLPTTRTNWAFVSEYFRHFNYYISSPIIFSKTAYKFLDTIMAPDVVVGSYFGVDAHFGCWELFALYFEDLRVDLKGLTTSAPGTLVARTTTCVSITNNTLCRAFPHLNSDGAGGANGGVWSPLAVKLLGTKFSMRGSVVFGWDSVTNKVIRVHGQADMISPMLSLLGNFEDVSYVFQRALVTPDCKPIRED
ncbi:uncharacterized protein CCR75_005076 [Bremia lactucae]|uniref:BZIP domain-containing protein n=1 Tax=Bremia lactucae TaxID=4779 RepID=A0A976P0L0_BRELC|nr:hypothetical protein CCR75_005076 [Bremia lactucae]